MATSATHTILVAFVGAMLLVPSLTYAAPRTALLLSVPGERTSTVHLAVAGEPTVGEPVGVVHHLPWAVTRGAALPGTSSVVVVTDVQRKGDGSFGAVLFRIDPNAPARVLADSVFHASRPLVTRTGRVFVERGEPGVEPNAAQVADGQLRTDALRIDEVHPTTGESRTVHRWAGYTTHLAGAVGDELLLYRVSHRYADLVAVNVNSGAVRPVLTQLAPFARDFSVDESRRTVLFTNYDRARDAWVVVEVDLRSGLQRVLAHGASPALAPSVWPGGRVVWNPEDARGLTLVVPEQKALTHAGEGVDVVRALSGDARWAAVERQRPGALPVPYVVSTDGTTLLRFAVPPQTRAEVLGFVEAEPARGER